MMSAKKVNYTQKYRFIASIWESGLPGKGTLSRFLTKLLIPKVTEPVICHLLHGFDMLIDPSHDSGVENSLYYFGTYEKGTLDFIQKNLQPGDVFLDIGGNIGLMSIYAAKCVGEKGKVYAFEANPETATLLEQNLQLNNLKNVEIVIKAVGSTKGKAKIYNNAAHNRGAASLIKPGIDTGSFDVDVIKLDDESPFNNLEIKMAKIDVEGFEMDVLKGMQGILQKPKAPILIVECSADRENNYDSVHEIFNFLKTVNGYKIFKLSKSKERLGNLVEIKTKEELPKHDNIFCFKN